MYTQKKFVNRGFLYGPLCPIYGSTAALLILLLVPFEGNYFYLFLGGAVIASVIEFITGYLLEVSFNTKWWDYSDEKYNIKGYVCLKFSIIWGILSIVFIRLINPHVSKLTYWIMKHFGEIGYTVILVILISDIALTINSLINFRQLFIELQDVMVEIRNNMDKLLEKAITNEAKINIQQRLYSLEDIRERLINRISFRHRIMLNAYPHITSRRFGTAIEEIKKKLEKIRNKEM
jgi:uncharacterized membrane protein